MLRGDMVRSETEVHDMREFFIMAGDDSPAINIAVRDALAWVLGRVPDEELIEEYFVTGGEVHCFTCPADWSG